jgi:hypothetical protein
MSTSVVQVNESWKFSNTDDWGTYSPSIRLFRDGRSDVVVVAELQGFETVSLTMEDVDLLFTTLLRIRSEMQARKNGSSTYQTQEAETW